MTQSNLRHFSELQDIDGLVEVGGPRVDADNHLDGALTFKEVPEQVGDLGVAVRHAASFTIFLVLPERLHAGAQSHQRVVDVSGLAKSVSGVARPRKSSLDEDASPNRNMPKSKANHIEEAINSKRKTPLNTTNLVASAEQELLY